MAFDYDELYKSTPDALGEPTRAIVDFFAKLPGGGLRVLDVGCGQGRDALFIARLGHAVVGVDLSPSGVGDLIAAAGREKLPIEGVVADITTYDPDGDFDVLLIDRTLHMLAEKERLATLDGLIGHVAAGGWAVIADERSNLPGLKSVFDAHEADWKTVLEAGGNLFVRRA